MREKLARRLCEFNDVDPDQLGYAIKPDTLEALGKEYKLWQYWALHYVDPMLADLGL